MNIKSKLTNASYIKLSFKYLNAVFVYTKAFYKFGGINNLLRFYVACFFKLTSKIFTSVGKKNKYCPCCDWEGSHFLPYIEMGNVAFEAVCPKCNSHGRHRGHISFYQNNLTNISGKLLYIAPEENVNFFLLNKNLEVKTSEYSQEIISDYHYDLEDIDCEDNFWDYIICHRVIEHISDDRKGMEELYRILKKGGVCILSVPIDRGIEKTVDFGQPNPFESDHFYHYGNDFKLRIPPQFETVEYDFKNLYSKTDFKKMGLMDDLFFVCKK